MNMSSIVHPKKFHELFVLSADLPNVRAILKILMTLPATRCTAECAFSALKRVKTVLRSTMSEERLEALLFMSIYGSGRISLDKAVDNFIKLKPRRC